MEGKSDILKALPRHFAALITAMLGVAYAVGFVVHNAYLAQFGLFEFAIVRSRYMYCGFMACSLVGITLGLLSLGTDLQTKTPGAARRIAAWLTRVVVFGAAVRGASEAAPG